MDKEKLLKALRDHAEGHLAPTKNMTQDLELVTQMLEYLPRIKPETWARAIEEEYSAEEVLKHGLGGNHRGSGGDGVLAESIRQLPPSLLEVYVRVFNLLKQGRISTPPNGTTAE